MKKYASICSLYLLFVFNTSCNGQTQKDLPKEKVSEPKLIAAGQSKFEKTQGSPIGDNVNSSIQDKAGNLWFGTSSGVYKYDGKTFSQFTMANGLNSNKITSLLEDKAGKIWVGTEAGLCLYGGKTFATVQIPLRKNMPANKYRNTHQVFSIMQDKGGKLWFATIDGVYIYDGKIFTPFIVKEDGPGFMSSNHNVEYILEDKAGNIWFGGRGNVGVFRYDGKTITNLKISEQKDFNWAWPALQDKKGNIWFSNWGGAYRYNGKSIVKMDGLSTGPVNPITRIIEDKKGNLWFGGAHGIWKYNGKSFSYFTPKDGETNNKWSPSADKTSNEVWSILEDRSGNLWIGTRNTGLYCFDGKSFISFSE